MSKFDWNMANRLEVWQLKKEQNMALTEKQRKKLTRFVKSAEDRLKDLMIEQAIQYFILFCIILMWDKIATILYIRHSPGISVLQILGASICLFQTIRFARKAK